jgi:hypothetical protein
MRWEGRRQSDNIEDRRGMRVSRGGLVGGGLGTLAIALLIMFLGGDPTPVLQGAGQGTVQTTNEPYVESEREGEWRQQTAVVLAETEDAWNKAFTELGGQYVEPKLVFFSEGVESGCGFAQSAVGPFYCPADQMVYIDLNFYQQLDQQLGAKGDFPRAYVVAHEVGHHVQNQMGITDKVHTMQGQVSEEEYNRMSVRLELQADFLAGVWAYYAQNSLDVVEPGDFEEAIAAAGAVGDDRIQKESRGYVVPDSFTHGTSAQRIAWFQRGFTTGDPSQGDTFGVDYDDL